MALSLKTTTATMSTPYDHLMDIILNLATLKDKPDIIEKISDNIKNAITNTTVDITMTRSESMEDDSSSESESEDHHTTPSKKNVDRSRSTSPIKVSDRSLSRSRSRSPIKNSPKDNSDNEYPNHRKGWSKKETEHLLAVKSDIKKHKKDKRYFEKLFGRKFSNIMIQLRKLDKEST